MPERYFSAVIIQIYAWKAFQRGIQNTSKICYSKKRKVEEGNMATIKEIAEKLGISTTTVSNVIHGKTGKMSADTRKKIEEALVRYHYVADYRTEKETDHLRPACRPAGRR